MRASWRLAAVVDGLPRDRYGISRSSSGDLKIRCGS
ncbi:hypothetical protein BCO18442_01599 [Burkholderia contaminans]|nr:hypothetical protein BCO18442_01599 [Burkholderia contaminans]